MIKNRIEAEEPEVEFVSLRELDERAEDRRNRRTPRKAGVNRRAIARRYLDAIWSGEVER